MANDADLVVGDYIIQAQGNINLQANGDYLMLNAVSTDGETGGYLALCADFVTSISCGEGGILVTKDEEETRIGLAASSGGAVTLATGIPATPSQLALEPEMITLSQGPLIGGQQIVLEPEKITLSVGPPGTGASVELAIDGITLQFAEWSLAIKASGITLTVGPSSVTVAPDKVALKGMMIDVEGTTQTAIKGLQTQINGEAMVEIQGALTKIG